MTSSASNIVSAGSSDLPANLALGDLALNAAIELERFKVGGQGGLGAVSELAKALSEQPLSDLTLVPVYDRALASNGCLSATTKNDLYSRLLELSGMMQATDSASQADLDLLRDFCVALHDALLTNRFHALRRPVQGQRRHA